MAVLTPHFDLPFRLSGTSFAVVEQDSYEDVVDCVTLIVSTPQGYYDDAPYLGFPFDAFENMPIGSTEIQSVISQQEPRAVLLATETMDELVDHVRIEVM